MKLMGQPHGGGDEELARWREVRRRHSPPSNEAPGIAAVEAVLVATDNLAVFVSGMEVYSTGVKFRVEARARRMPGSGRRHRVDLLGGMHDGPGQRGLLLGVEFSDGRRTSTLGHNGMGKVVAREQPVLADGGGGGSEREADMEMFLSPLPPPGDLLLVCVWPDLNLDETITRLPTQPILDAVQRVRVLWPPDLDDQEEEPPEEPPPPPVPPDSWFRAT
jgi:hypothetical protein